MIERVFIYAVKVKKKGEVRSFQIKLPEDAKRLIGVETTVRDIDVLITPSGGGGSSDSSSDSASACASTSASGPFYLQYVQSYLAGDLRLQSCEEANVFYAGDVWLSDNNLGRGDFSQVNSFRARPWTHGYRREEDIIRVDECCPVILGTYRDQVGKRLNVDAEYTVNVYLWYSTEEKSKCKCKIQKNEHPVCSLPCTPQA